MDMNESCNSLTDFVVDETGTAITITDQIRGDLEAESNQQRTKHKRKSTFNTRRKKKRAILRGKKYNTEQNEEMCKKVGKKRVRTPGPKSHVCSECGLGFHVPSSLEIHTRKHTGERPFKCKECDKMFTQLSALKVHQRHHTGEKPFICQTCHKCFSQSGNLQTHMRKHTGEKPFMCCTCGRAFSQKGDLQKHSSIHTQERPFICHQCGMTFRHRSYLQRHLKFHNPTKEFQCEYCPKSYTSGYELRRHVRYHTGDKPHICDTCGKGFTMYSRLTAHKRIHTGEKPFACFYCSFRCNDKGNLGKHMRKHIQQCRDKDRFTVMKHTENIPHTVSESQPTDCLPYNYSPDETNTSLDNFSYSSNIENHSDISRVQEASSNDLNKLGVNKDEAEPPANLMPRTGIPNSEVSSNPFVSEKLRSNREIIEMVLQKITVTENEENGAASRHATSIPILVSHEEAIKAIDTVLLWLQCQPEAESSQTVQLHQLRNLALAKCRQC